MTSPGPPARRRRRVREGGRGGRGGTERAGRARPRGDGRCPRGCARERGAERSGEVRRGEAGRRGGGRASASPRRGTSPLPPAPPRAGNSPGSRPRAAVRVPLGSGHPPRGPQGRRSPPPPAPLTPPQPLQGRYFNGRPPPAHTHTRADPRGRLTAAGARAHGAARSQ